MSFQVTYSSPLPCKNASITKVAASTFDSLSFDRLSGYNLRASTLTMDAMQVQAAISALYGSDTVEAARANTFLMEFTEQPVSEKRFLS